MSKKTSWGGVANWYEEYLKGDDTYHAKVIAPNLMRILEPRQGMQVLDLACGEGYFARLIHKSGADVIGADIAHELIAKAKKSDPDIEFHATPADTLDFAPDSSFDAIVCVLALQNMQDLTPVFKQCARVLKPEGRFIFVLNHPAFRIPKRTSWGWDEEKKIQYRRVDGYLSSSRSEMEMTPGSDKSNITWSFHRSLQDHMKPLANAGFAVTRLEEWISHKQSEKGPRSEAEDISRKEFPLFLCVESKKIR